MTTRAGFERVWLVAIASAAIAGAACKDVDRWSSKDGRYEGTVVAAEFVRSGVAAGTKLCLTLDTAHLHDIPGTVTSSDGRFAAAPLTPIRAVSHDPLSTLTFGNGRTKNLLFGARTAGDAGAAEDVLVIVSLMDDGSIEARLLRPSPSQEGGAGVFAVFPLEHQSGACSFGSP